MNPAHHPSETVLADYASGALADGPSLAVSAHLEFCAACRKTRRLFEAVGGALIEEAPAAEMQGDALALALARIERPAAPSITRTVRRGPEGVILPMALADRPIGRRRFLGPHVWVAPVPSRSPDGWRTYLLRAPAGATVPHHGHRGAEYTVLLRGAFTDGQTHYALGDFAACDETMDHHPRTEGPDPCICLISGQGGIRAEGLLRLVQPLLGV